MWSAGRSTVRRHSQLVAAGLGIAVVVAGCGGTAEKTAAHSEPPPAPPPPATVSVEAADTAAVALDQPVIVSAEHGKLTDIHVTDSAGDVVAGALSPAGLDWTSSSQLAPETTYQVSAEVRDLTGHTLSRDLSFVTAPAEKTLQATISPGDGAVVGVGQPIIVSFDRAVTDRALVEHHLSVTMSMPVTGAWRWMSDREVHFRPETYWPSGEQLTVATTLDRINVGDGVWGHRNSTGHITIGNAHVSHVDIAAHMMTVTDNGAVVRTMLISAGRDKYPTAGGVHVTLEKMPVRTMDSATVGIPRNSADGYYEKVYSDVRISNGGEFVHAAPWSVKDQGHTNVSHGCVNLNPADALWFYHFSQRGDIVDITNSPRPPDLHDPGMADWNVAWSSWAA